VRSTERRLGVHHHLLEFGLIALPPLLVAGHERFNGRLQQLRPDLIFGAAAQTYQAILFQRRQHHAKFARAHGRYDVSDLVDGQRVTAGRVTKAFDERGEVVVRRIPPGHEESLQATVASLEQQDAVSRLAVPAGSARLLVVDVE
jgi:hypothetical protein